jgi:heme A synthase
VYFISKTKIDNFAKKKFSEKILLTSAQIALILVYLVIFAGAFVRLTGSGMGCPDWPKCWVYIPPTEQRITVRCWKGI